MKATHYSSMVTCIAAVTTLIILTGCASSNNGLKNAGATNGSNSSRATVCKTGDTLISSANQCLQDDAACYEISTGQWCTGERGNSCPTGSTALPAGTNCPPGKRCFRVAESLECTIL